MCSTSVTSAPIRRKNCASSTPTAPPPSTIRLAGMLLAQIASRFVQYVDVAEALERRNRRHAIRSRRRARRTRSRARRPRRRQVRTTRALAAHELGALILDPAGVPRVVAPVRHLVAPPEHALDVDLSGHRLGGAGRALRGSHDLGRPQQRLRRQARVVGALAAGELALDDRDLDVGIETAQRPDEVLAARAGAQHDDASAGHQTERAGFEPATHLSARTRFPVALLRPLGHLSKGRSLARRRALSPASRDGRRTPRRPGSAAR